MIDLNFDTLENMNPEDLWNEIESGKFNLVRNDELNRIFTILFKKYEKLTDIQKSRRMLREVRIHSMFYNTDMGRFMQIIEPWGVLRKVICLIISTGQEQQKITSLKQNIATSFLKYGK